MALVTQKEYARRRNVTPQYVSKLVRENKITLSRDGKIDPKKADKQLAQFARPGVASKARAAAAGKKSSSKHAAGSKTPRDSATVNLTAMRAEEMKYKAAQARLNYEKEVGQLLPRVEVLQAEQRKNAQLKLHFRKLPRNLAPRLARLNSPAECEALLLEEIDALLAELAADPLGLADLQTPAITASAPPLEASA